MNVLVACEFSGLVRDAFLAKGHNALSCDLLPSLAPGPHYQGNVLDLLNQPWDLLIAFPPCTYLARSGIHHTTKGNRPQSLTEDALSLVQQLLNAPISKIALENPVGIISTRIRKPDQIIHPSQFGHDASKKTCLWLKNLPLLRPTDYVAARFVNGQSRWGNQTDLGHNNLPRSKNRQTIRNMTYPGIAQAMADQWG